MRYLLITITFLFVSSCKFVETPEPEQSTYDFESTFIEEPEVDLTKERIKELQDSAKILKRASFRYSNEGRFDSVFSIEESRNELLARMYDLKYANYSSDALSEELAKLNADTNKTTHSIFNVNSMYENTDRLALMMYLVNLSISKRNTVTEDSSEVIH